MRTCVDIRSRRRVLDQLQQVVAKHHCAGRARQVLAQSKGLLVHLGGNLARSPGAVVFRNDLLELIQYVPSTSDVYARPHLIVPPQINKYYIFDLSPGRSIVEFMVKSGFQVFVVSWRNPTPAQRSWDMEAYVAALLQAIEAVRDIADSEDANLHRACSGPMTIPPLLRHPAAQRDRVLH